MSSVSFLTNHAHVLVCVATTPGIRLRDVAGCVGITERATHRIVCELETDGYLTRHREGRRNVYEVHPQLPLVPGSAPSTSVGELLELLIRDRDGPDSAAA
jgi:predicted transcriptional regulator